MQTKVAWPPTEKPLGYIRGSTVRVEAIASMPVALGHEPVRIKTERYGPTGGQGSSEDADGDRR